MARIGALATSLPVSSASSPLAEAHADRRPLQSAGDPAAAPGPPNGRHVVLTIALEPGTKIRLA